VRFGSAQFRLSPKGSVESGRFQEKTMMFRNSSFVGGLVAAVLVAGAYPAHALTVFVERLTYTENGSIAFQDEFNDPLSVPAFSNGTPGSYVIHGSPGPEANGKLRMSTDDGRIALNAIGGSVISTRLRLNDNRNTSVPTGIRPGITFSASALFDLPASGFGPGEGFSLSLREYTPGGGAARTMRLRAGRAGDAAPSIHWYADDFLADTITTVDSAPLLIPGGADQMLLLLDRRGANSPVTGGFQFFRNGAEYGWLNTSSVGIAPFLYADRMNAEIIVSTTVVPVPGSLALLLSGAAIVGLAAGKRGRKS
jgi:hypothetical protein